MNAHGPILVPLDGSELAERAVSTAASLARSTRAGLVLAHVHAPLTADPIHVEGLPVLDAELHPLRRLHEQTYLERAKRRLAAGADVSVVVLEGGPVGASLVRHAAGIGARLIVMATHGRGGVERAWLGSVADDIVRQSPIPLLLLRPHPVPSVVRVRRILVPVDGSALAEAILEPVLGLARLESEPELVLLTVIPQESPGFQPAAHAWLDGLVHRLDASGVRVRTRVERADSVAHAILDVARQEETDVLAVATHGRSGLVRLALGSVADELVRRSHMPILLWRPQTAAAGEATDRAIELEAR
jgi:nucleotide-binding universal stress UspA family protein